MPSWRSRLMLFNVVIEKSGIFCSIVIRTT
jgi:hypothetical protein